MTTTVTRGVGATDLDASIVTNDLINGLIATELPGDLGWHPANPASGDSLLPSGLPAFTDGAGELGSGLTGLLNDFPPAGSPTKLIQYDLASPADIERIHILSGNRNNADGRIFTTTVIRYSTNGGASYDQLGYFESAPLGSINAESGVPGVTEDKALLLEIFDDAAANLLTGVTNLQFDFYAVDNTQGEYRDPFDGVNPFTNVDDQLTAAFVSPLIWEIDVIGQSATAATADFDQDGDVDGADFITWQRGVGITGTATRAQGDANGDMNVDGADLAAWRGEFGSPAATAIPEPASVSLLFSVVLLGMASGRLGRRA